MCWGVKVSSKCWISNFRWGFVVWGLGGLKVELCGFLGCLEGRALESQGWAFGV